MPRFLIPGCFALVIAGSPVIAEQPEAPQAPRPETTPSQSAQETVQMAAFLGVQTDYVPESLAWHLNLKPGFGLMVLEVMPESPADKAGMRPFDVLLRYEDQQLVNMDQLQVLVRSGKQGQPVDLLLLSKGKEKQVTVTLEEGPVQVPLAGNSIRSIQDKAVSMLGSAADWERRQKEWTAQAAHVQGQLKSYQQQLGNWVKNGSQGPKPASPDLQDADQQQ